MSKSINLFIVTLDPKDAAGWYRVLIPFQHLQSMLPLNISINQPMTAANLISQDLIFMHRPCREHLDGFRLAKKLRKPVWIEWDDHCLDIPSDHFVRFEYEAQKEHLKEFFKDADYVSFMTEEGKNHLSPFCTNPGEVIPMAFHDDHLLNRKPPTEERKKVVFWRGSRTHHKSLFYFKDAIIEVANKHKSWTFRFQGDNPWWITDHIPNWYTEMFFREPIPFLDFLNELNPSIVMAPLVDNPFTRCRSNLAWMEGSWGGAHTIAPDWEHWKRMGVHNYINNDTASFALRLDDLMSKKLRPTRDAWEYIENHLVLSVVNKQRAKIIKGLL